MLAPGGDMGVVESKCVVNCGDWLCTVVQVVKCDKLDMDGVRRVVVAGEKREAWKTEEERLARCG